MRVPPMEEIISDNLLAKAGPFVTAGEKRTARELQKLLVIADNVIENPYIAPELGESYRLAQPQSDVFSLALVFLERWSGQQLKTLRPNVAERVVLPDLQACWPLLPSEGIARLAKLFDTIFYSPSITRRPLSTAVAERLKEIARTLE